MNCILPENISVSTESCSGCLTHQVMPVVLSRSLCKNGESNLDFRAVYGRGEAQGRREMSVLGLVNNRGWKDKVFQSVKREVGKKGSQKKREERYKYRENQRRKRSNSTKNTQGTLRDERETSSL